MKMYFNDKSWTDIEPRTNYNEGDRWWKIALIFESSQWPDFNGDTNINNTAEKDLL